MKKQLRFSSYLWFGIVLFLFSVNATTQGLENNVPKYKGEITSLTEPVQAKYRPVKMKAKMLDIAGIDSNSDISISGVLSITDNRLQWDLQYKESEIADNVIAGKISTDYYGNAYRLEKPFQGEKEISKEEMKKRSCFSFCR